MALPAGRYGVTKNQLLKIKKLPMNTIKLIEELTEKFDLLGTAAFKNSTSVVTDSSDLVESGAVKDAFGFGNKNLFDPANIKTNVVATYVPIYVGSGVFTMSTNMPINTQGGANLFILAGNVSTGASTATNGVWSGQTRTVTAVDGYVTVASRNADGVNPVDYNHQLEKGSTATSYEPYHENVVDTLRDAEVIEGKNLWEFGNQTPSDYNSLKFSKVLPAGTYILSAKVTTTYSGNMVDARFRKENTSNLLVVTLPANTGKVESVEFTLNEPAYYVFVYASTGNDSYVCSWENIMLRKATETDPTYEPYYTPLKDVVPTKADNSVIAPVEDGATASQDYAVGQHFIRDGAFCTCTQPIAQGGSFILGTNYTVGDVASEFIVDNAPNLTVGSIINLVAAKRAKVGNIVIYEIRFTTSQSVSSGSQIAWGLDVAIPLLNYISNAVFMDPDGNKYIMNIKITDNGTTLCNADAIEGVKDIRGSIMYICE